MSVAVVPARKATARLAAALNRLLPQLTGQPSTLTVEGLAQRLERPEFTLLVARDADGQIVGTATLLVLDKLTGRQAQLEDVVVDAGVRGQGIGEALTREVTRLAAEAGALQLDLTSSPHREAANRLYQRLGFARRQTNVYRLALTT